MNNATQNLLGFNLTATAANGMSIDTHTMRANDFNNGIVGLMDCVVQTRLAYKAAGYTVATIKVFG